MSNGRRRQSFHDDSERFREALGTAAATTGFSARLIEKDYYCSVLLGELRGSFESSALVFKGGTCLSKVHAEFYRLSEDLDFCVSIASDAPPGERRRAATPLKDQLTCISARSGCFQIAEPLQGHNSSRQYNGKLAYQSAVTGEDEFIKVEVSLREPILLDPEWLPARTMLRDPETGRSASPDTEVRVLSIREAYAEKIRAALTRREPAIRDFFDIDSAIRGGLVDHREPSMLFLVAAKLTMIGDDEPVDTSEAKFVILRNQLDTQLRPVLRTEDYDTFDLARVMTLLTEMIETVQKP